VAGLAILSILAVRPVSAQRLTLRTEDGVSIAATWYEPSIRPAPAVILVHMLHRSRGDWDGLARRLTAEGIGALALDLRGHGESGGRAGGDGNEPDYPSMVLDLRAARTYLAQRSGVQTVRIGIMGASIGANLATLAASDDPSIASLALLSPSLDYRGLRIEAAARKIGGRPVLMVASDDDPYALRSARELQKAGGGPRDIHVVRQAGHGTAMLARDPDLSRVLVDWFRRTLL
jgi:alpha-beta hydrolase superfamily lysophospholipase